MIAREDTCKDMSGKVSKLLGYSMEIEGKQRMREFSVKEGAIELIRPQTLNPVEKGLCGTGRPYPGRCLPQARVVSDGGGDSPDEYYIRFKGRSSCEWNR